MLSFRIEEYELQFKKPAKTSRNTFKTRKIFLVHFQAKDGSIGIGEAAPLNQLSIDDLPDYKERLAQACEQFCLTENLDSMDLQQLPSIRFGLETAQLSLKGGDILFDTPFSRGKNTIPINGLVWMNNAESMLQEALSKAEAGFRCIKFKIGALDFDQECRMLEAFRARYNAFQIEIRLDANGAFKTDEAAEQLKELERFEVHSIEQPIAPRNWDELAKLCHSASIPIALDEELIGLELNKDANMMLGLIKPQFLILKPNLIGGFQKCDQWIQKCQKRNIGWWATSALESNIGLNAIAQWVSTYQPSLYQGLGTGSLYENNLKSNLILQNGLMRMAL